MRRLLLFVFVALFAGQVQAYFNFSAICSSGQTLYYWKSSEYTVRIVQPNSTGYSYDGYIMPKGDLVIPESVTFEGNTYIVTEIGNFAFGWCKDLTSVSIPNSITNIYTNAFVRCDGLKSVIINSEANLRDAELSFKKGNIRYKVKSKNTAWVISTVDSDSRYSGNIVIPTKVIAGNTFTVTGIGYKSFAACIDLTSISIPNSVTYVSENAFESCIHLTTIYCQAKAKPSDWDPKWNPNNYKVVWGAVNKFK